MLTIIGTGKKGFWTLDVGRWTLDKKILVILSKVQSPKSKVLFCFLFLIACKNAAPKEDAPAADVQPKAQVTVAAVTIGDMNEQVPLSAVTAYVQRNMVTAPIPCFLMEVKIKLGQSVHKGEVLYVLESKERKALGDTFKDDPSLANLGKITIEAPISGIVTVLDRQQVGDYVTEGNPLCTITDNNSVVFQLNVPYEYTALTHIDSYYTILLPDKKQIIAKLTRPLTTVLPTTQTQQYWLKPDTQMFLPEGLITTVMLTLNHKSNTQMLPKECVLSDELLKDFWVMKMINDSTAVKIPVQLGMRNLQQVEITNPKFNEKDKILSDGNYGLADTAAVKILSDK